MAFLKRLLVLLLAVHLSVSASFKRYTDYREYVARWKAIVPEQHVHDVSYLALDNETCYGGKCEFLYFESEAATSPGEEGRTVLLVSGMHGDEFIGPHTLL
jgi:hypothetical protein